MEEDVVFLDSVKTIEKKLSDESVSREATLRNVNDEVNIQMANMMKYNNLQQLCRTLQEDLARLEIEYQLAQEKIKALEEAKTTWIDEGKSLRIDSEKNRKRKETLQSFLVVLIEKYGIEEISRAIGIPYIKLKEYLQD